MNLHILTKQDVPKIVLNSSSTDSIILMNEAIYIVLQPLPTTIAKHTIYVLNKDLLARGGTEWQLPDNVQTIDYSGLVDLCAQHKTTITW